MPLFVKESRLKQIERSHARKNATPAKTGDASLPAELRARQFARQARGILHPQLAQQDYQHYVQPCVAAHQSQLQSFWMVRWDCGEAQHSQVVLSHPHCHLVFEDNSLFFYGVQSQIYRKDLHARGQAFGLKFHPASAWGLWQQSMQSFRDQKVAVPDWAAAYWPDLDLVWASQADWSELLTAIAAGLSNLKFAEHEKIPRLNQLIASVAADAASYTVASMAETMNCSARQLQRDFARFVGIHPKWLIQRYRLHQVLAELQNAKTTLPDLASLALTAGYYDQAHFNADFVAITGYTPQAYWRYLHQHSLAKAVE